jgi:hypothetical protein
MKKKLLLFIWVLGLVLSTGFAPLHSAPDTGVGQRAPLGAAATIQVQLSVKNASNRMAVFSIGSTNPYFGTTIYVPKGAKITKSIKVVPGKFMVVVGFGDEQHCKSIGKTIKISKSTKRLSLSFSCGKFQ